MSDSVPMPDEWQDKPKDKQRTLQQNRALHKYFELLADELNTAGLDMRRTLKPGVDIPWSQNTVKDFLWRPIQRAQLQKESTTELTTKDIDTVYDTLNRYLSEKHGLTVVFPSIEEIMMEQKIAGKH